MAELTKDDPIVKWHAIWKAFSGSIMVALSSSPTVILGWDTMITSGKIVAVIGILIGTIKSLDMFFDQTMSRLAAGKLPVKLEGQNGGDTKHITKTGVTLGVLIFMAFYISLVAAPSGKSHVSNADTNRVVILNMTLERASHPAGPYSPLTNQLSYVAAMDDAGYYRAKMEIMKPCLNKKDIIYTNTFSTGTKPAGWTEWESGLHPESWNNQIDPMLKREFQKPSGAVIQPMIRLHFCHPIFENLLPSIIISLRS